MYRFRAVTPDYAIRDGGMRAGYDASFFLAADPLIQMSLSGDAFGDFNVTLRHEP